MAASALLLPPIPVTPPSYHRIVSDTLTIPSDKTIPIPVGILACQRDPLLRELVTTVVHCTAHQKKAELKANNRKKKGATVVDDSDSNPLYEVVLHDTVLFPEGGGQPSDIGLIRTEDGRIWNVVEVKRQGGHAVHFVRSDAGKLEGFEHGASVTTLLGEDGFRRRLDHMSMHTSQHVLSALLETRLNLPTLSWALTSYPTPAYVELSRSLTLTEITAIQEEVCMLAFEGRQVHVEVEELDRQRELGVKVLESGRTVGKALPADYTGGVNRTVVIDGVDRNPCCGTHMPTLHNLQIYILPQTETLSRSSLSTSRLFFLCGPRLLAHLNTAHNLLTKTSETLSCGPPLVPERVSQVVEDRKRADKRVEELEFELAKLVARNLFQDFQPNAEAENPVYKKHYHRTDNASNPLPFLQAISMAFTDLAGTPPGKKYVLVLSSSPASQTSTSTSVVLIAGSSEQEVKPVGEGLKVRLGVKGGGKGLRWSGKFTGLWKDNREGGLIREILEEVSS